MYKFSHMCRLVAIRNGTIVYIFIIYFKNLNITSYNDSTINLTIIFKNTLIY